MNENKKSFWSKPEGFTGMLFLGGLGITAIYFWAKIVPFLLLMITNTIYMVAGLVVLGVMLYVLLDPSFRNLAWYVYKSMMKSITSAVIQMDPIAIMKTYLVHLKEKKQEMWEQIEKLAQQIGVLKRTIEENERTIQKAISIGRKAEELGQMQNRQLAANEIGRMTDSNKRLNNIKEVMGKTLTQLEAMHKNSEFFIIDMESEIRTKEIEYKAVKASSSAIKAAKSILNGDLAKKMIYDESLEALSEDMGKRVGEIEFFMKTSASFIDKMDLQTGMFDEEGYKQLEQMNTNFFKTTVTPQLEQVPVANTIDISHQVVREVPQIEAPKPKYF